MRTSFQRPPFYQKTAEGGVKKKQTEDWGQPKGKIALECRIPKGSESIEGRVGPGRGVWTVCMKVSTWICLKSAAQGKP